MCRIARAIVVVCCCGLPGLALAQGELQQSEWSRGTTLNGFGGAAADSSQGAPALGGAIGWEVTPGLAIEGSGAWMDFGHGTTSFAGALKVRARLWGHRSVDPFVQAGVGLYRAAYGADDTAVPEFYRWRINPPTTGVAPNRIFTDPTLVAGAGVSLFVNRHFAIRPDVEAVFVIRDGRSHIVTIAAIHAVYHFEDHPVTADRRR